MKPPRLVLVRPRNPDNLVSIAQAMRAFGWTDWVAVSQAKYFDGMLEVLEQHRPPSGVEGTLRSLRRAESIAAAVADCSWVVGTSMRSLPGQQRLSSRELAPAVAGRGDRQWALVFGAEANGLQNDDLRACHAVAFIPADDAQPSLNLSQAVVVFAHELWGAPEVEPRDDLVDDAHLQRLRADLEQVLKEHGFPVAALDELMAPLLRAGVRRDEGW